MSPSKSAGLGASPRRSQAGCPPHPGLPLVKPPTALRGERPSPPVNGRPAEALALPQGHRAGSVGTAHTSLLSLPTFHHDRLQPTRFYCVPTRFQGPCWEPKKWSEPEGTSLFSRYSHHCGRRQETNAEKSPGIMIHCDIRF